MSVLKYAMNACVLFLSLKPQFFTTNNQLKDLVKKIYFCCLLLSPKYNVHTYKGKIAFFQRLKLNYCTKVFYIAHQFIPWEFLSIKRLDFEKTKAT